MFGGDYLYNLFIVIRNEGSIVTIRELTLPRIKCNN